MQLASVRTVTNEEIIAYLPVVEQLAAAVARSSNARRVTAEYDDLYQEGCIYVWLTLRAGKRPAKDIIHKRMLSWVRYLGRHEAEEYEAEALVSVPV